MFVILVRTVFLLFFLVIVSQGIFYLLAASKAFSDISIDAYAEIRNSIDRVIEWPLKVVYPATLLVGLISVFSMVKVPASLPFITTTIAFLCVVVDIALAVKFNMPINEQFHSYTTGSLGTDWESLRDTWLQFIGYRAVVQVVGFLALLVGWFK